MSAPSQRVRWGGATGSDVLFDRFLGEVALRQLDAWLPPEPAIVLDVSTGCPRMLARMAERGHTVVHAQSGAADPDASPAAGVTGRLATVCADDRVLDWVADAAVDAVVAEGSALSDALVAELTLDDVRRVLRPGGRLLLCVDSLVAGLSRLADQGRWAELADVPAADVVLVPDDDGSVSRCFWPEEVHAMLTAAGFDVDWIRPRTVLTEETVSRALEVDPGQLESLVTTELALAESRQGESMGAFLVASARRAG